MDEENYDPRKNVLQGILQGARSGMANGLKQKYKAPQPNLEANAKQPVPGAEMPEGEPVNEEDEMARLLEEMSQGQPPPV